MLLTLAVAIAYASTNFDNLALMLALAPSVGIRKVVTAFATTQGLVIVAAIAVGTAADSLPADWLGFFGLVPMAIGVFELWKMWRRRTHESGEAAAPRPGNLTALMFTFAGLSMDSFALTAAFLADSASQFDLAVVVGAVLALAAISLAGISAARVAAKAQALVQRLNRITPFIMIASGLYILLPTLTDVV
ncbi:MAG: hypothetical protein AAF414_11350 [Pseudomonadota bacterium]